MRDGLSGKTFGAAAILAGGKSRRMGGIDKQTLVIRERRLIDVQIKVLSVHFSEIIIVTASPELYGGISTTPEDVSLVITGDQIPGFGPLSGIHAALSVSSSDWVFMTACDMPHFSAAYMEYCRRLIGNADPGVKACVSAWKDHIEPFHAFYSTDLIRDIEDSCVDDSSDHRVLSIGSLLGRVGTLVVPEAEARRFSPDWSLFFNINTPGDLRDFEREDESTGQSDRDGHKASQYMRGSSMSRLPKVQQ